MSIPYILTDESLTVVINGKAQTMRNDHVNWQAALDALSAEEFDSLPNLFDESKAVQDYFDEESGVMVCDGAVFLKGEDEPLHGVVIDKILHFMRNGLPFKPLLRFAAKMADNPSRRAINELYTFLEHKAMPLTPDGNFIAYKGVKSDFKDHYSGKFDNSVGEVLEMRRNRVCDDADIGCSYGFHAGSYEYAKGYASRGGNLMVVEIDPRDVVSVPHDCECQKLRTSKYVVVGHYETIDAPPLDDGEMPEYIDWDDDFQANEDSADYGAGWDAGYDQAKKDLS